VTRLRVATTVAELDALGPAWGRLAEAGARTPFQTHHWHTAWWRLVGVHDRRLSPHVVTLLTGGRVAAIAPLMISTRPDRPTLQFSTHPDADYQDILVDPGAIEPAAAWEAVAGHAQEGLGRDWEVADLDELPPWSVVADGAAPWPSAARHASSSCARLDLGDGEAVAGVMGRGEFRVKRRRLERIGRLEAGHWSSPDAVAERMPVFMAMHLRQWEGRPERRVTFEQAEVIRFYTEGMRQLAAAGQVLLSELLLDGQSLAFYLGFLGRGTFWGYRTTYDLDFRRYSPGHLLHRFLIEWLLEQGFSTFDLMRGDYAYKGDYATHHLTNSRVVFTGAEAPAPTPAPAEL